ncbi:fructose-6-phosphate aldolase [Lachnospiraceae bacterium LCP25S3_G4]
MKYLLDTANLSDIRRCADMLPISGVTTNPTIIKKEGNIDFFAHIKEIRSIIGFDQTLHVQVTSHDTLGMLKDADTILKKIDQNVFIKIPTTLEGIKAMKALKSNAISITATAIYSKEQGFLALEAGADYIAPYYNRMENMGIDSNEVIVALAQMIERYHYQTNILAASFKNIKQVNTAFLAGAQTATLDPSILIDALKQPAILSAVDTFEADWHETFHCNTIAEL